MHGRGTGDNPPSRYDELHVELDEEARAEAGPTRYFRDASRSVLAENDSPDVPFRYSINPYRGCEHGCVYCLEPNTPILYADLTWRPIGEVQVGDVIAGFDESPEPGRTRKWRQSVVEAVWWSRRPSMRLRTEHAEVVTTAEHRWLQARNFRWSNTAQLRRGQALRYLPVTPDEPIDDDYRVGYLAGLSLGDGTFRYQPGWRSNRLGFPMAYWRIALVDDEPLLRTIDYLCRFAVEAHLRPFSYAQAARKALRKVEIRSLARLAIIHGLITIERDTRSYRRGFVAGFFDAEGHAGDTLRISQVDLSVLDRVRRYALSLGFTFKLEPRAGKASTLRLMGSLADRVRFFSVCRPAIARKVRSLYGREMNLQAEAVQGTEEGPTMDVVDIQTSTRTFYAAGLATHNCYARPSHEYLGFSAGLDFERRILVKDDAPALLRRAFARPSWEGEVVALSGNTDCYQPVERRLELTRRCLEVFAECRNPVGVITKSALVARDADLLAALAAHGAAHVFVTLTTLDDGLAARLEPRAARPARRLDAIRALAAAGVPTGVLVAPVIAGLTDREIPSLLEAAAAAGARAAGWTLMRLPPPVDALFEGWLAEHYPERAAHVMNRIRDTRSGGVTDSVFGRRHRGEGAYAGQIAQLFGVSARKLGLDRGLPPLSSAAFRRPARDGQLRLW